MLKKISGLRLNPYINIIVFGDKVRNNFLDKLKENSTSQNKFIGTITHEYEIEDKKLFCNLWNVPATSTNNTRYFFSGQIDYCIIVCNINSETKKNLVEYIASVDSLCKNVDYVVIGITTESSIKRISSLETYIKQKGISCLKLTINDWVKIQDFMSKLVKSIFLKRKTKLNQKFQELIRQN